MIFHITTQDLWEGAVFTGHYHDHALDVDGFIHCSLSQQLIGSANKYFHGQAGLVILCIAAENVTAPIIYEDSYDSGQEFPHIYGVLNLDAVKQVIPFPVNNDGSFGLPEGLYDQNAA